MASYDDSKITSVVNDYNVDTPNTSNKSDIDHEHGVKRGLRDRHISMLAIAGIIGPGLLVGAGSALQNGGPASLLISFGLIGMIAYSVMQSLGEITTLYPGAGSFIALGDRFVDKAFGFVVGVNYWIIWTTVLANEYNVISSIFSLWTGAVPTWGFLLIFWFAFLTFQLIGVKSFGEAEFWLALTKLVGITAFFFFSLIYICGGIPGTEAIGFRYWNDPGAFNGNGFGGLASVFAYASTFYAGTEAVAVTSTEARNPLRAIPRAIRQVIWRILFIYMGTAFFYGVTVPADSPEFGSSAGRALRAPMTIAITNAGWAGSRHLINAFIFITVLSACNSSIYIGSRSVCYMAQEGMLPRIFGYVTKRGVPIVAILLTNGVGLIALMNVSTGAAQAYTYIVNLSGVSTFIAWAGICYIQIRFRAAWLAQGHTIEELPFKAKWYPYNAYFGLIANIVLAFIQGWVSFSPFHAGNFVVAYILLALVPVMFFAFKFIMKTQWRRLQEVDLVSGKREDLDPKSRLGDEGEKVSFWKRIARNF